MSRWLTWGKTPDGLRFYIFGRRVHHLEAGLILILIGWILVLHDWILKHKKLPNQ